MLGASGTPVLDAVGKLGDLGDRLSDKHTLLYLWTDDPVGRTTGLVRYDAFGTTIQSDGDYPLEGIPLRLHPTIRFGMAVDAINVSETTYLTVVRYYLANLGTTMESQVRSFVKLLSLRPFVCLSISFSRDCPSCLNQSS